MKSSPSWHKTENKRLSNWRPVEMSIVGGQTADGTTGTAATPDSRRPSGGLTEGP